LANGKSRNGYNRRGAGRLIKHPFRNLVGTAVRLTNQEIANTVMHLVPHDQDRLTDKRVERIPDLRFECQKPGTMIPVLMKVAVPGHVSRRSPRLASSTASIPMPG
jgi:hypothetical protein